MSSAIRELIWLEINKHPGATAKAIQETLGCARGNVQTYLGQLYRARMIDRTAQHKPTPAGNTCRYFTYVSACDAYKWTNGGKKFFEPSVPKTVKKAKPAHIAFATGVFDSVKTAPDDRRFAVAPNYVDSVLNELDRLPLGDVLRLRKAIDEALTV